MVILLNCSVWVLLSFFLFGAFSSFIYSLDKADWTVLYMLRSMAGWLGKHNENVTGDLCIGQMIFYAGEFSDGNYAIRIYAIDRSCVQLCVSGAHENLDRHELRGNYMVCVEFNIFSLLFSELRLYGFSIGSGFRGSEDWNVFW